MKISARKLIASVMAGLMLVSLAACSTKTATSQTPAPSKAPATTAPAATPTPAAKSTEKFKRPAQAPVPDGTAPVESVKEPYVWRKINDRVIEIAEIHQPFPITEPTNPPHTQTMPLIIGDKKAAIIDTGLGIADLRKFCEQFTDLPIIVLNTHGHVDHVGANQLFDISYIHQKDEKAMLSATREGRINGYKQFNQGMTEMIQFVEKNALQDKPFKYEFIKGGDIIDLGGIQLEVVEFPGHSDGSVAFLDRQAKLAFTGDSILFRVLLKKEAVAQYLASLDNYLKKAEGIETIINGHQWEPFTKSDINDLRAVAVSIVDGTGKGTFPYNILGVDRTLYQKGKMKIAIN